MLQVSLEQKLTRYMIVAGAALSVASNAKAGVVQTLLPAPIALGEGYTPFDLDGDSFDDFAFSGFNMFSGGVVRDESGIIPLTEGYLLGTGESNFNGADSFGAGFFSGTGPYFIGLELVSSDSDGNFHANYGYAQLNGLQFQGYAYETTVDTAITLTDLNGSAAPEPGTWGTLALGAAALGAFGLRKRSKAA